jgi:hypothetical protein
LPGFGAAASIFSQRSSIDQRVCDTPAAIAGVMRKRGMDTNKIVIHEVQCHGVGVRFHLFGKAVGRVKRRLCIRMVRFWRSANDVLTRLMSGLPSIRSFRAPAVGALPAPGRSSTQHLAASWGRVLTGSHRHGRHGHRAKQDRIRLSRSKWPRRDNGNDVRQLLALLEGRVAVDFLHDNPKRPPACRADTRIDRDCPRRTQTFSLGASETVAASFLPARTCRLQQRISSQFP